MPDGKTASEAEMVDAMQAFKAYNEEVTAFGACLEQETKNKAAGTAQLMQLKTLQTKKHNAAVDELQAKAKLFNEQVRLFKARAAEQPDRPAAAMAATAIVVTHSVSECHDRLISPAEAEAPIRAHAAPLPATSLPLTELVGHDRCASASSPHSISRRSIASPWTASRSPSQRTSAAAARFALPARRPPAPRRCRCAMPSTASK